MKKSICVLLVLIFALSMLSGCDIFKEKYTDYYFEAFDTVTVITGYESDEQEFKQNCDKIKEKLRQYHNLYNIYDDADGVINLKAINEEAAKSPVKAESEIIELLLFSIKAYELTGGRVNIAMGSVLSIWHEYRENALADPENASVPSQKELEEAAEHTDIYDIIVDSEEGTVYFTDPKVRIDVGAVAKGYAAERICEWMKSEGMDDYTLSIGGNVCALGDRKWVAGIENPDTENTEQPYIEMLTLKGASLVTSGSYQRFYTVGEESYHHIIDPDTLMPAKGFTSVSVLCESGALADALSTALFTLDYESGKAIVEAMENTYAMWVTADGEKLYSEGFTDYCR